MYWQQMPSTGTNFFDSGAAYGCKQENIDLDAAFYQMAALTAPFDAQAFFEAPGATDSTPYSTAYLNPFTAPSEGTSTSFTSGDTQYSFQPSDDMYITADSQPRSALPDYNFLQAPEPASSSLGTTLPEELCPDGSIPPAFPWDQFNIPAADMSCFDLEPSLPQAPQSEFVPQAFPAPSALTKERFDPTRGVDVTGLDDHSALIRLSTEQPIIFPNSSFDSSPALSFTSSSGNGGQPINYSVDPTPLPAVPEGIFPPNYSVVQAPNLYRPSPPLAIAPKELVPFPRSLAGSLSAPDIPGSQTGEVITSISHTSRQKSASVAATGPAKAPKPRKSAARASTHPYTRPSKASTAGPSQLYPGGTTRWQPPETPETLQARASSEPSSSSRAGRSLPEIKKLNVSVSHACVAPKGDSLTETCGERLEGVSKLVTHLIENHGVDKEWACPLLLDETETIILEDGSSVEVHKVCGARFVDRSGLTRHVRRTSVNHLPSDDIETIWHEDGTVTTIKADTRLHCVICDQAFMARRGGDFYSPCRHLEQEHGIFRPRGMTKKECRAWKEGHFVSVEVTN